MKQVTITTQVVHVIEYDNTQVTSLYHYNVAEVLEAHVREAVTKLPLQSTFLHVVELEVLQDPNPVVVDI